MMDMGSTPITSTNLKLNRTHDLEKRTLDSVLFIFMQHFMNDEYVEQPIYAFLFLTRMNKCPK